MIKATGEAVLCKTPLSVAFSLQKLLWHNYMFYFFIVNMFFEICYFNTITNSDECALAHSGAVYAPAPVGAEQTSTGRLAPLRPKKSRQIHASMI